MERLEVVCAERGPGWECRVQTASTEHVVSVSGAELARFAPGHREPTRLVEESYRFLLEREPANAILRRFGVSDIEHYFPDYPDWIIDHLIPPTDQAADSSRGDATQAGPGGESVSRSLM